MYAAIKVSGDTDEEPVLIVGNQDDFLSKLRAYYLEYAYGYMSDNGHSRCPDPEEMSATDIALWFEGEHDDTKMYLLSDVQPNPGLDSSYSQKQLAIFRAERVTPLMPEGQTGNITVNTWGHQLICQVPGCGEAAGYMYKNQPYCYDHASAEEGLDITKGEA